MRTYEPWGWCFFYRKPSCELFAYYYAWRLSAGYDQVCSYSSQGREIREERADRRGGRPVRWRRWQERGGRGQAVSDRFIRSGEISKTAGDSCHRAQYCLNGVSLLRPVALRNTRLLCGISRSGYRDRKQPVPFRPSPATAAILPVCPRACLSVPPGFPCSANCNGKMACNWKNGRLARKEEMAYDI